MKMEESKTAPLLPHPALKLNWKLTLFILLQLSTIAFVFICISSRDWIHYCWFKFGILTADNIRLGNSNISQNIDSLRILLCQSSATYTQVTESYCPGFCTSIKHFEHGGGVLLFFMLYTVATGVICIVLHLIKILNKDYRFRTVRLFALMPMIFLMIGVVIYLSITDFAQFEDVNTKGLCAKDQPVNLSLELGALLWLLMFCMQVGTSLFGFLYSGKEFKRRAAIAAPMS